MRRAAKRGQVDVARDHGEPEPLGFCGQTCASNNTTLSTQHAPFASYKMEILKGGDGSPSRAVDKAPGPGTLGTLVTMDLGYMGLARRKSQQSRMPTTRSIRMAKPHGKSGLTDRSLPIKRKLSSNNRGHSIYSPLPSFQPGTILRQLP